MTSQSAVAVPSLLKSGILSAGLLAAGAVLLGFAGPVLANAAAAAGEWSIVESPNTSPTESNKLEAVTCVSAADCWAVGHHNAAPSGVVQTLIERWDGNSWMVMPSPNTLSTQDNYLYAVTCSSAADCWAVGHYGTSPGVPAYQTLILHWTGSSWTIVSSPNTSSAQTNYLRGVSCTSSSNCWAVGYHETGIPTGPTYQTLIERWDGASWSIVSSPNTASTQNNYLYGVTCAAAADCWAVGEYINTPSAGYQTLVERWNGTLWSVISSPNPDPAQHNFLFAVSCSSPTECSAVGDYFNGTHYQTHVQRWNGGSWAVVSSPNPGSAEVNTLYAVKCVASADCWAVGASYSAGNSFQTLIEHWNGSSWMIVPSPNESTMRENRLRGLTCTSASDCWAVGYFAGSNGASQTLTLRYRGDLPLTPETVVSRKLHGTCGVRDIDLPLIGSPGIECRSGGANRNYEVVFTFPSAVTFNNVSVAPAGGGTAILGGTPTTSPDGTQITVKLAEVSNAQTITITLLGVSDGTHGNEVSIQMGVLLGDTIGNGSVNSSDISQAKAQSGQAVTASNFRQDVTASGSINSSDISLVKSRSGTALP